MSRFADTVEWAQDQAKEALGKYNQARKASQDAYETHKKLVDTYNDAIRAKKDHLPLPARRKPTTTPARPWPPPRRTNSTTLAHA